MSTGGYTDCVPGTFYGFNDNSNNEFWPGETVDLQWGAIDNGDRLLNITLGRPGGTIVDPIVAGAQFSKTSSLYQLVSNTSANCTLEQYTWAIPSHFNTTDPLYQLGLFDGAAKLGDNNTPLNGWIAWSPDFYVRKKSEATSASASASATGMITGTGSLASATATATTTSSASPSSSADSSSSNATSIGVGVGVGVGGAALIAAGAFWFFWRRRKAQKAGTTGDAGAAELAGGAVSVSELPGTRLTAQAARQAEAKPGGFHEMPGAGSHPEDGTKPAGFHDMPGNVTKSDGVHEMEG